MHILAALDPRELTTKQRVQGIVLFFAYFVGSQISFAFFTAPAVLTPAPGIALAGLVLCGLRLWPAILLAAVASGLFTSISAASSFSPLSFIMLPLAQTLQAIAGAYILKKIEFDPVFRRLKDMLALMGVALIVSAIVPSVGYLTFFIVELLGGKTATLVSWGSWWTGHILSLLIVAPLFIRWLAKPIWHRNASQIIEIAAAFLSLFIITGVLYFTTINELAGISLIYVLLAPLFWISIRLGSRLTILAIFITALMALAGALYGPVPPDAPALGQRIFELQVFLIILAVIFYIITGLQEERTAATKELKSYINQLERALNQLSMQDRAKSDFVAILAHELRNPLAPVVSTLELMRLNLEHTQESIQALDLMDDHLRTIQRLLDDLLDVSRISRAKLKLKKEPVELRAVVDRSIQSVERYLKTRNQTLVLDLSREPLVLDADPVRIEQIINNLLSNASKFTPESGRISISTKREDDAAVIRVTDSGIGIDPHMLDRIFEPFIQLEARARPQEGLGIGLSLTQKLVEMHGGTIDAFSEGETKGSEFTVRLPLLPTYSAEPLPIKGRASFPAPSGGARVLVVDDNAPAAQGIGRLLEHKGYNVEYAYTGEEARAKAKEFELSAIVLDIGLPDMNGYDVARLIRSEGGFKGTLIALTGYGQEEDKLRAQEAGFNHHLTKPVGIADLLAVLAA